jgi:glycosyltransferase involved in cell wall biosynthesis
MSEIKGRMDPSGALRVLTITPFYPTAGDDARGCFVAEPLVWTERLGIRNEILAVTPMYRKVPRVRTPILPTRWIPFFSFPSGWGLASAGAFLYARLLPLLRRRHAEDSIDLVHAHAALPCGHAATLLQRELGIPFVVTVHGLDAFSTLQVRGRRGRWCRRVSRMVYNSAKRVICVSRHVGDEVWSGAPAAQTTVIYNGVDTGVFSPPQNAPGETIILSVGNLIPTKGHEVLLRSVAGLRGRKLTPELQIIGDGPELPRLQKLTVELGITAQVRFLGRQSRRQVASAMQACTIFALPSRYEGLGCAYLEAMACAKPIVGCRGQGIEEVIQPGVNGMLVDEGGSELPDVLELLLRDSRARERMGELARRTILDSLTLQHQAVKLASVYGETID